MVNAKGQGAKNKTNFRQPPIRLASFLDSRVIYALGGSSHTAPNRSWNSPCSTNAATPASTRRLLHSAPDILNRDCQGTGSWTAGMRWPESPHLGPGLRMWHPGHPVTRDTVQGGARSAGLRKPPIV